MINKVYNSLNTINHKFLYYKKRKMELSVLSSGSSGNCFYIENDKNAVLIDCGISCKQIVERLGVINKKPENIKAVFITHEHSDHIKGVDVFARNFNVPVFATKKLINEKFLCSKSELINELSLNETNSIGNMEIEAFSKSHKAIEPVFFTISNGKKISVITDAGFACNNIIKHVSDSDCLCLESNHDLKMLEEGPYPWHLKKWIKSNIGHLSNNQASLCVLEHAPHRLKNIVLSHLSETNNAPELAHRTFSSLIKERKDLTPKVIVSSRFMPTSVLRV